MSKYKRTFLIALAVVVIVAIFLFKNTSIFQNKEIYQGASGESDLTYANIAIENLVNRDTDLDGILDWEEGLWGTDPTKKETIAGIKDSETIAELKAEQAKSQQGESLLKKGKEKLTQTDQFSRELFSTVAALSQNGEVDEATIEALSISLAEKIRNPAERKVFSISDLKIAKDDSIRAYTAYETALNIMYEKHKMRYTVLDILSKFMIDEDNVDVEALKELDQIIIKTKGMIDSMTTITVPPSIAIPHLQVTNTLQGLVENISDIRLYEDDAIVAMGATIKYGENAAKFEVDINNLVNAINKRLGN